MTTFTPMHKVLKPGTVGAARLETFTVSKEQSQRTAFGIFSQGADAFVAQGTYCRLYVGRELVMSDTQMERRSNYAVVHQARGDVFIAGLGLGMILVPILAKEEVESVLVVERSQDVIELVAPQIRRVPGGRKLNVVQGDVFDWKPADGQKFDTLYFDIWSLISEDNLSQMARLHQKFKGRKKADAWMESWKRDELKWKRQQSNRQEFYR